MAFHVKWRARSSDSWKPLCRTFNERRDASKFISGTVKELKAEGNYRSGERYKIEAGEARCGLPVNWMQLALLGGVAYAATKAFVK